MRRLLRALLRRREAPRPEPEAERLLRIYRETAAQVEELRCAA